MPKEFLLVLFLKCFEAFSAKFSDYRILDLHNYTSRKIAEVPSSLPVNFTCDLSRKVFSVLQLVDEVSQTKTCFQNYLKMCFAILKT